MSQVADVFSWIFLLGGSALVLVTGVALLRLPRFFPRVHGASVTDTLGAGLILLGLAFQAGLSLVTVKLALILVFMVITGPVAAHTLAKAAYLHNVKPIVEPTPLVGEEEDEPSPT